jgi:2-amino-4-hydroxy-6-hydroxymethyldihydropteridine diphosphokinase
MILVGLGSNIHGPWGGPKETVLRALEELNKFPLRVKRASSLIITKPFGVLNQPDFVNAVAEVETALSPESLMAKLHLIERAAGRRRRKRWGPRSLDLDLLDYHGLKRKGASTTLKPLRLPHPGVPQRSFVLKPIAEIAPRWRHPTGHLTAACMLNNLR